MNSQLKFRTWEEGKFNYMPILMTHNDGNFSTMDRDGEYEYSLARRVEVQLFTGFLDIELKEIYGQDIVERKDGIRGVVCFERQAGCWWIKWKDTASRYHELSDDAQQGDGEKIVLAGTKRIGSTYENPGLIEL